jgi:PTS system nitrogen regulatory IIA component
MTMYFGATLRLMRLESGLSLRDLARRLGVSSAYLSRVENGLDAAPTSSRLEAMARELDVPAPLLMALAHRVSPFVVDYVDQVPEAGSLFLEIAHRRLDAEDLDVMRAFVTERFPLAAASRAAPAPRLSSLLSKDRVVLGLACVDMDDVFDVAAGRLASEYPGSDTIAISAGLRKREAEVSSAVGNGVAVPTAYIAGADHPVAVMITLAEPLPRSTPDGEPLRLVFVLAGPRRSSERRLVLAQVARLSARGLTDEVVGLDSPSKAIGRVAQLDTW